MLAMSCKDPCAGFWHSLASSARPGISKTEWIVSLVLVFLVLLYGYAEFSLFSHGYKNPNYILYADKLEPGWLFGLNMDNSDLQYRGFRSSVRLLIPAMVGFLGFSLLLKRLHRSVWAALQPRERNSKPLSWHHRIVLQTWHVGISLFCVAALVFIHGASACGVLFGMSMVPHVLGRVVGTSKVLPPLLYSYCIGTLFLIRKTNGLQSLGLPKWIGEGSLYPWHFSYNFAVLRMISFGMDFWWAQKSVLDNSVWLQQTEHNCIAKTQDHTHSEKKETKQMYCCRKRRVIQPLLDAPVDGAATQKLLENRNAAATQHFSVLEPYGLFCYFSYVFYFPLYFAGPIMTFNNWVADFRVRPQLSGSPKDIFRCIVRLFFPWLVLEIHNHLFAVIAMGRVGGFENYTSIALAALVLATLGHINFKLMAMWRFFRIWAIVDGYEAEENMEMCLLGSLSILDFWRKWHVSFNKWLLRYIYIPLGGRKSRLLTIPPIFAFVAMWHELEPALFVWCLLIVGSLMIEIFFTWKFSWLKTNPWYSHVAILANMGLRWLNICANLTGFAYSYSGVVTFSKALAVKWDALMLLPIFYAFTSMAVEIRERVKSCGSAA